MLVNWWVPWKRRRKERILMIPEMEMRRQRRGERGRKL